MRLAHHLCRSGLHLLAPCVLDILIWYRREDASKIRTWRCLSKGGRGFLVSLHSYTSLRINKRSCLMDLLIKSGPFAHWSGKDAVGLRSVVEQTPFKQVVLYDEEKRRISWNRRFSYASPIASGNDGLIADDSIRRFVFPHSTKEPVIFL